MSEIHPTEAVSRYDSHLTKFFDRLDNCYKDIEIKEYKDCLLAARQLVLSLLAMRKYADESATGSAADKYGAAFQANAARRLKDRAGGGDGSAADGEPTPADWDAAILAAGDTDGDDADGPSTDGNGAEGGLAAGSPRRG